MDTSSAHMTHDEFPRQTDGLPHATPSVVVDLAEGERFNLTAAPLRKKIGDSEVRLLAYNGSVPGPTLRVRQNSTVTVDFTNQTDLESTVHWHGLRLDNRYDGTHETQAPVPVGGHFTYHVHFPDPGIYWYHPHIREDYGQEMGLYGNVLVVPDDAEYWPPVHREIVLTLDDILLEDGKVAAFSRHETTHTAMGRYGNVLLTGGETDRSLEVRPGEVVRLYLTNTANTRTFNVAATNAQMKLVGSDSGRCENESFVESVVLAPSERVVVDVRFDKPGEATLEHRTPDRGYRLVSVTISGDPVAPLSQPFDDLRANPEWIVERHRIARYLVAEPDRSLAFVAKMTLDEPDPDAGPVVYACPMHPEVIRDHPGSCPKCGMKLLPAAPSMQHAHHAGEHEMSSYGADMHDHHTRHGHHEHLAHNAGHHHGEAAGIEWEDEMVEVNRMTTPANMRWLLVDRSTGAENHAIDWRFRVGDRIKIRLINEMDSDHPMQHPFHIHGAGRFMVLSRDGVADSNLMWKDTVLVRTGQTVDILLEVSNPGTWMAHCHIAEHHESGMMFSFDVDA
jgi:FtsP/CotA-like multicopper oxidase with cupredoxin domain